MAVTSKHTNFDPDNVSELGWDAAEESPVFGIDDLDEVTARYSGYLDDGLCLCRLWKLAEHTLHFSASAHFSRATGRVVPRAPSSKFEQV